MFPVDLIQVYQEDFGETLRTANSAKQGHSCLNKTSDWGQKHIERANKLQNLSQLGYKIHSTLYVFYI